MALEHLCRGLVRVRAHHCESAELVPDVADPAVVDLLGFAERAADLEDRALMFCDPGLPGGDPLLLLGAAFAIGHCIPRGHAWRGLAADEDGEIGVAHCCSPVA